MNSKVVTQPLACYYVLSGMSKEKVNAIPTYINKKDNQVKSNLKHVINCQFYDSIRKQVSPKLKEVTPVFDMRLKLQLKQKNLTAAKYHNSSIHSLIL